MQIKNFFKMNDWDIKSFLIVVFSIQLAYLGAVGLDKLDIQIPLLRQILGFIYLTFIPGYLLLRILKIHKLSSEESFLYAIGLSLFFIMFVGFLMNMFYPLLGITDRPISEIPIVVTLTSATLLLSILAYFRDKDYNKPDFIDSKDILNSQILFLSLIPFMAIFGTYLVNYYHTNILLMIMIAVLSLVALIIGFANLINIKYYAYAIWVIAISLILHITLITEYIPPLDVVGEFIVSKTTIVNGIWNPTYLFTYNSDIPMFCLFHYNTSLVCSILWPIYSLVLNLELNEVYKLISPSLYSLVIIAVYDIFVIFYKSNKKEFNCIKEHELAWSSTLLVCAILPFYRIVPLISKQSIAELFFVLILLLLLSSKQYNILLIIFMSAMIVSHYSVSFIYLIGLTFGYMFMRLSFKKLKEKQLSFIIIFGVIVFISWYSIMIASPVFSSVIWQIKVIIDAVITLKLFMFEFSRGFYLLSKESGEMFHKVTKFLYLYIQSTIIIGLATYVLNQFKRRYIHREKNIKWYFYSGLSIYAVGVLIATIIPYFAVVDARRLFHMFSYIIGVFYSLGILRILTICRIRFKSCIKLISTIGVVLLLIFGSGFVYEITKDYPNSISLSYNSVTKSNDPNVIARFYMGYTESLNVVSARWLSDHFSMPRVYRFDVVEGDPEFTIYGGFITREISIYHIHPGDDPINGSYIYLSYPVAKLKTAWKWNQLLQSVLPYKFPYSRVILKYDKIYTNSGSEILWIS